MADPLQTTDDKPRAPLFDSTSRRAAFVSALSIDSRRYAICKFIQERGPSAIFEIAAFLGLQKNQISGRFSELERDGLIYRTGNRRPDPQTGCDAELYGLRPAPDPKITPETFGYPLILNIGEHGQFIRRSVDKDEELAGIPYARDTRPPPPNSFPGDGGGGGGGLAMLVRLNLILCPRCDKTLKFEMKDGKKTFSCGSVECNGREWELTTVKESGKAPVLALVMYKF